MGDSSWLNDRLSQPDYNNWVKGNLILREFKTGLAPFLDEKAKDLQRYVRRHIPVSSIACTVCTGDDLRRGRHVCRSGICTTILQDINTHYIHHPPGLVKLMNTDNKAWCDPSRYWEIAKAYISKPGYASKRSAAETDCVGLLTIIIKCTRIQSFLAVHPAVFEQIKVARNVMMHSEDSMMSSGELDNLFDDCVQVLQDSLYFAADLTAQGALARIREIKDKTLTLSGIDLPGVMFIINEVKAHQEKDSEVIGNLKVWQQLAEKRMEELAKQQTKQQQEMSQLDTRVKRQREEQQQELSQLHTQVKQQRIEHQQEMSQRDTTVGRQHAENKQAISQLHARISDIEVRKSTESSHMTEAVSASTSITNFYGGPFNFGTVHNYHGTGNSSTNTTAPGYVKRRKEEEEEEEERQKKQRKAKELSAENSDDTPLGAEGGGIAGYHVSSSRHHLRNAYDPIVPRSQEYIVGAEKHPKVRKIAAGTASSSYKDSLLLLYPELKDKLRRDQCRAIAKDITAGRPLTAEEKLSFQKMTKRRNLVDWVLKYVLNQKDEIVFKIFCESLCKHSPSLGQTLQETSVQKHELVKTERQPTTIQLDDLHFLQRRCKSKLVVDIIIDQLLSRFLITVEEHSSIQSSSYEVGMIKRLEALLQYDQEIMQQFKLITQSFRNASVAHTADWLVPLHALAKETLSCGKCLSIATYIFQKVPGIISPSDLDELYKLKDNSRDVIDRLLKLIYRHPQPEMFDVICYSLEDHDEKLYEHFLRMFFFKGGDKEKTKPVVNKDSAMPSGSGTDHLDNILWNKHTLDVVIDHLLSSFYIKVYQHSDIRETGSINYSITQLVELLKRSPQMIMAVNAILRHLDKIADTTNTGNKEITISVDFGDPEVNSQAKNYMDSRRGHTLTLDEIGRFYINDVEEGSVVIKIVPLDQESLIRFRDMQKKGTILGYLKNHVFKKFLPKDVEFVLSEPSIGVMEETTCVPVQSAHIINATIELSSVEVYKMENESFDQSTILQPDHHKCIGSIRMFANELLSQETKSKSPGRGLVFAGRLGSNGEPLAIKRMDLQSCNESLEIYKTVKERLQHRNIVRIFCVEKDEVFGYVAMERMDENLDEYLTRSGQHGNADMSTEEEIYYMKGIVTGLAFIHEKGCLHNVFSGRAILLKRNNPDTHPKQVSIACFSVAALGEQVPVSCMKGTNDVLALTKVLLFVLNKKESIIVNGVIQPVNSIIQSGHFDIFVLLQRMLDSRLSDGLKLQEFVLHPALSNPIMQLHYLKESDSLRKELGVDFNLTNRTSVDGNNPWLYEPTLTSNVSQHLNKGQHGKYNPHSLNSLVHCIRNCHQHLHTTIPQVKMEFGPEERYIYYWLVKFPGLVSSVYEAMRPHDNHTGLIRFFIKS